MDPEITQDEVGDLQDGETGKTYSGVCIPVPQALVDSMTEGDDFDGPVTGKVIMKDGVLQVEVETLNGEQVEKAGEPEYTGTETDAADMDSSDALDKFMKGRKVTQ